jgi:predicted Fe-S protein YdhL (DUF1289 family)
MNLNISSPCINICQMDASNGLCLGCFRTIEEITVWSRADDAQRANILAAVTQRRLNNSVQNAIQTP